MKSITKKEAKKILKKVIKKRKPSAHKGDHGRKYEGGCITEPIIKQATNHRTKNHPNRVAAHDDPGPARPPGFGNDI